ncbi:muts domain V-domain-containing protein [Crucibulum laeve]|uniref:DNA mismatch repair protein MSH3 n=1 Tax=Crucibulum laeve TaxID=68775 RepID=A0A5C3MDX9_9AGAR|nr:muts domain V-domain-containing protein [Crucibulum laeve]
MPSQKSHSSSQSTISTYFKNTPPKKGGKRPTSPIDLTSDNDTSEPPLKKRKNSAQPFPLSSPAHASTSFQPSQGNILSQWQFDPNAVESPASKPCKGTREQDALKRRLRDRLKDNNYSTVAPHTIDEELIDVDRLGVSASDDEDSNEAGDSDTSSNKAFSELQAMFSNDTKGKKKSKAKGKAKANAPTYKPAKKTKMKEPVGLSGKSYTPLELQAGLQRVVQLQKDNPGTILMIEVGYKYKFFGKDAQIAAKVLGMVAFMDRNFLVASIPTHRRDVHLKNLLAKGYRVGIVTQVETAALKKVSDNRNKPFDRRLTNLYTSATYVDELGSVDDTEQYSPPPFMCIIEERKRSNPADVLFGMITICPSTGDVIWDDFEDSLMRLELETRLIHIRPTELLLPKYDLSQPTEKMLKFMSSSLADKPRIEYFDESMSSTDAFDFVSNFYTNKQKHAMASENFKSGRLMAEATGFPDRVVIALAHAIKHLAAFNIADAFLETKFFSKFSTRAHMLLAANALINLEVYQNETDHTTRGSLIWILDKTKTKFGARLLRNWIGRPLVDKRLLESRVSAVEEILESSSDKFVALRQILKKLPDLAKGLCRIQYGQCTPKELAVLLTAFRKIANAFECYDVDAPPSIVGFKSEILNEIIYSLPKLKDPIDQLISMVNLKEAEAGNKHTIWTDPQQYPGIDNALAGVQVVKADLQNELKKIRKELKLPSLNWTSVAGDDYVIEVKRKENRVIPESWPLLSRTKTLARYQPQQVRKLVAELAQHEETLQNEANTALRSFLKFITDSSYSAMRDAVNKLAVADCLLSFAQVALQDNYVRPEFTDEGILEIVEGRHPMVEALRNDPFVPNSIQMGGLKPCSKIITGPNMGGKSSCVRMIAIIAMMAQIGSYVPAKRLKMGLLDSIFTRMGASDDLARGRSTFMVEMTETSEILHAASTRSLVILDELGRGTSTFDGMAIAEAVLQQLVSETKCKTLFITHYPLVASSLEKKFPAEIENLHMGYEAESRIDGSRDITFLYRLTKGMATESFGIECGRLAGLSDSILNIASERAIEMQQRVEAKIKRNKIHKAARLLNECLVNGGVMGEAALEELHKVNDTLSIYTRISNQ